MKKAKKKNHTKIKYKKVNIKLSASQVNRIDFACKTNKITRNKFIKNAIKKHIEAYDFNADNLTASERYLKENQLQLYLPE
ncbi:MAG: hypothetical protein KA792_01460 [Bacteroidales bacterium]|nr:hypothetical protein [Bacteroidales bacterium]